MTSTPPSLQPPTWEQPPPPARTQLRRSSSQRMLGGVSGGLADYSGVDPLLWRAGFVALTCAGGSGLVVYLVLWVLMPSGARRADERLGPLEHMVERLHAAVTGARGSASG